MLDREVFNNIVRNLMIGDNIQEFEHQGYKLNPDKEYVDMIINGVKEKQGYCPCKIDKTDKNKCACEDFINTGKCCCKLWVKSVFQED